MQKCKGDRYDRDIIPGVAFVLDKRPGDRACWRLQLLSKSPLSPWTPPEDTLTGPTAGRLWPMPGLWGIHKNVCDL